MAAGLKNDKENFTVLQTIRQQQSTLNGSWVALLQTRNTLNRAGIRYMMDQNNIGSGSTVAELMQSASISLKQAEKNWALLQTRNTLNRAGIRYMMDQNNIGSGSTVAELMQSASISLKQAEKNWADYEALPRDPRQSTAAAAEINA